IDERDITLTFTLQGSSPSDYITKYKAFLNEITKGEFTVKIQALGEEVYHLYYIRSASFGINTIRTFSKISVKLNEPNPGNREYNCHNRQIVVYRVAGFYVLRFLSPNFGVLWN